MSKKTRPFWLDQNGHELTSEDLNQLRKSYISQDLAEEAGLFRVDSETGKEIVGAKDNKDYRGIVFPYFWPGNDSPREYRLRRDYPDLEEKEDGRIKEIKKYLSPPGRGNKLYFAPNIDPKLLTKKIVKVIITEGEKKALALHRLQQEKNLNWLIVGLAGVWCWRGVKGKVEDQNGKKRDIRGVISDFDDIAFDSREVYIVFDTNIHTNDEVAIARYQLSKELKRRGAKVTLIDLPNDLIDEGINGVDDLLYSWGADKVLDLFEEEKEKESETNNKKIPSHSVLCQLLGNKFADVLSWDTTSKDWLIYQDQTGIWQAQPDEVVSNVVYKELDATLPSVFGYKEGFSNNYLNGAVDMLKSQLFVAEWKETKTLLPFKNGVLDLVTRELIKHSPSNRLTWVIPYDYQPTAKGQMIVDWLGEVTKGDNRLVELLRAFLRAILTRAGHLHRFLELVGPGGAGKGTFIRLATVLVGMPNVCATDLKQLELNRFESANIYRKKLTVITDSDRYGGDVATLKAMTGGDQLRLERKNEQQSTGFTYDGMVMIAANEAISSSDYTSGLERRRISVFFDKQIKQQYQKNLVVIDGQNEASGEFIQYLPGFLNWVLEMDEQDMVAMLKHTAQVVPNLAKMKSRVLVETNNIAQWLNDAVIYDTSSQVKVGIKEKVIGQAYPYKNVETWLYPNYVYYCDTHGNMPISAKRFTNLLIDLCVNQLGWEVKKPERSRDGYFVPGLRLRMLEDDEVSSILGV